MSDKEGVMPLKRMTAANVVCPYYKCEEGQKIFCEGVERNTAIHLAFAAPPQLKDYKSRFCEGGYGGCRIADMLERKWDDAGKK